MRFVLSNSPRAILLGSAVTLSACAVGTGANDDAEPGENIGTTSDAITINGGIFWGQPGNSGPDANLGSDATQTCYLTAVHGQLKGTNNGAYGGIEAAAYLYRSGGNWWLATRQGGGEGVNAEANCIPAVANRQFYESSWAYAEYPANIVIPHHPNRQCFISGIHSYRGFQDTSDWTGLRPPGGPGSSNPNSWEFRTRVKPAFSSSGNPYAGGRASVVCVDVPVPLYGGVRHSGSDYLFSTESGIACGLTFIDGNWFSPPPLGGNDGVRVWRSSTGGWRVHATSGKTMATGCIR